MLRPPHYCTRCVYPNLAVNLDIDDDGVCSACLTAEDFNELSDEFWEVREARFKTLIDEHRSENKTGYDCLIPVSGGKDSFYQIHVIAKKFGLKPLLVTYHGNNYLPEGDYNRELMRHAFDADHIVVGPSIETLKKLNRLCFRKMGDMNWHAHCGIFTVPIQIAVRYRIPLIIWGEIAWDISGMHSPDDFVEFSARVRHEHALRGFEWYNMTDDEKEPLSERDLQWAQYPSDEEILDVGVRGLYVGNFFKWDPNRQAELMKKLYGWKEAQQPFDRTYRRMSNLDDRYENGIHDLMKFVKFGYGPASDHASKDIRTGDMSREEGIAMVKKYDHVVSSDLEYWLNYVDMAEEEFWQTADSFRDPRVWWIKDGQWWKHNLWGDSSAYGKVHLNAEQMSKYQSE